MNDRKQDVFADEAVILQRCVDLVKGIQPTLADQLAARRQLLTSADNLAQNVFRLPTPLAMKSAASSMLDVRSAATSPVEREALFDLAPDWKAEPSKPLSVLARNATPKTNEFE